MSCTSDRCSIMTRFAGAFLALSLLGSTVGCSDSPTEQADRSPTPCFTMSVYTLMEDCPFGRVIFFLDPMCSKDDRTYFRDLDVRWDFDDDGIWDTEWGPIFPNVSYDPNPIGMTIWRARCEVRDAADNTSVRRDSLDLRAILPEPPDIIAGRIVITTEASGGSYVDTVSANQAFGITIWDRCWLESDGPSVKTEFRIDGALVYAQWGTCMPGIQGWCFGHGRDGFVLPDGGVHQIEVVLDADNEIIETNEANNSAHRSLVVVPTKTRGAHGRSVASDLTR